VTEYHRATVRWIDMRHQLRPRQWGMRAIIVVGIVLLLAVIASVVVYALYVRGLESWATR
jgi:hypothetical protein